MIERMDRSEKEMIERMDKKGDKMMLRMDVMFAITSLISLSALIISMKK